MSQHTKTNLLNLQNKKKTHQTQMKFKNGVGVFYFNFYVHYFGNIPMFTDTWNHIWVNRRKKTFIFTIMTLIASFKCEKEIVGEICHTQKNTLISHEIWWTREIMGIFDNFKRNFYSECSEIIIHLCNLHCLTLSI